MSFEPIVFNHGFSDYLAFRASGDAPMIEAPSQDQIRATLGLRNASVEDAVRFGGEITREALSKMRIRNDRRFVVVDVKVHMLMKGMCPAIPGWHTDGVPRGENRSPLGPGDPDIWAQHSMRAPRYHLIVTPGGACTEFIDRPVTLVPTAAWTTPRLYAAITAEVEQHVSPTYRHGVLPGRVYEFDWWDLHRGIPADRTHWRYLIRVAETDHIAPERDLREVLRTQQQVYVPMEFGW